MVQIIISPKKLDRVLNLVITQFELDRNRLLHPWINTLLRKFEER